MQAHERDLRFWCRNFVRTLSVDPVTRGNRSLCTNCKEYDEAPGDRGTGQPGAVSSPIRYLMPYFFLKKSKASFTSLKCSAASSTSCGSCPANRSGWKTSARRRYEFLMSLVVTLSLSFRMAAYSLAPHFFPSGQKLPNASPAHSRGQFHADSKTQIISPEDQTNTRPVGRWPAFGLGLVHSYCQRHPCAVSDAFSFWP